MAKGTTERLAIVRTAKKRKNKIYDQTEIKIVSVTDIFYFKRESKKKTKPIKIFHINIQSISN